MKEELHALASKLLDKWRHCHSRGNMPESIQLPNSVGACTAVFWWDDKTPLLEYEFLDDQGNSSGYIILSTSRAIPPVHEFAFQGVTLSAKLFRHLTSFLGYREAYYKSITWYYFGQLDLLARCTLSDHGKTVFVSIPQMTTFYIPEDHKIERHPNDYWSEEETRSRWRLIGGDVVTGSEKIAIELEALKPVPYNQNCRATTDYAELDHYCKPNCIAGCSPVAVAMYASSKKKSADGGANSRIWPGSNCWEQTWPSDVIANPNTCADVSTTIWELHDRLRTTCDGLTKLSDLKQGAGYFRDKWGLNWKWKEERMVNWERCATLISEGKTFIFSANGPWTDYLEAHFGKRPGDKDNVGHSTVCWGHWGDPMVGGPRILVCYGWGDFSDDGSKWIDVDAYYSNNHIMYV